MVGVGVEFGAFVTYVVLLVEWVFIGDVGIRFVVLITAIIFVAALLELGTRGAFLELGIRVLVLLDYRYFWRLVILGLF